MTDLFFDNEFRSLIPPLSAEEREGLEESLKREGNRDPIIIWKETRLLLDGHNRYDICTANGISLQPAREMSFPDRNGAKVWIIRNQLGRRNLPAYPRTVLALQLEELLRPAAKEMHEATYPKEGQKGFQSANVPPMLAEHKAADREVREQVARVAHVSHGTVDKVKIIEAKATPEQKAALVSGEATIHSAYMEIKRDEARVKLNEQRAAIATLEPPKGLYRTLIIDPPWEVEKIERDCRPNQHEWDYPPMDVEAIKNLRDDLPFDESGCHVYLWTTQKYLPSAFDILEAWGVRYQCLLTWVKNVGFTPFSWMYSTEHCLFGRVGNLPLLQMGRRLDFAAPVRQHSRKPDEFYALVREVSPGPRIDYFSREKREGFDQFGNDTNHSF